MSVILAPIPDSIPRDEPVDRLQQLIAAINGYAGQGIRFNLTEYRHDEQYALAVRNKGADGFHLAAYHSTTPTIATATPLVEIQDLGLFVTDADLRVYDGATPVLVADDTGVAIGGAYPLTAGAATFGGTVVVSGTNDLLVGGTISADEGLDVIGGAEISGTATFHGQISSTVSGGTAPLVISTTTLVGNLNADLLDGQHASAFALDGHTHDVDGFLPLTGGTMTGDLTLSSSADLLVGADYAQTGSGSFSVHSTILKVDINNVGIGTGSPNDSYALHVSTDSGRSYAAAFDGRVLIQGDVFATAAFDVDGNCDFGTNSSNGHDFWGDLVCHHNLRVNGAFFVDGNCDFGDNTTDTHIVNGTLTINHYLNLEQTGSASAFTRGGASFDGYAIAKYKGSVIRLPFWFN